MKNNLKNNCPRTTVSLQLSVDVVETLKEIAKHKKLARYQTLIVSYISLGIRSDIRMKDVDDAFSVWFPDSKD